MCGVVRCALALPSYLFINGGDSGVVVVSTWSAMVSRYNARPPKNCRGSVATLSCSHLVAFCRDKKGAGIFAMFTFTARICANDVYDEGTVGLCVGNSCSREGCST